jgi:1-acyl-sn-glycerol-3-phosphate acyltransferase
MVDTLQTISQNNDWRDTVTWYTHETNLTRFVKMLCWKLFHLLAKVECEGLDNVPDRGPCIAVANHFSLYDVIYVGLHLPRHPYFMAKIELYKNPLFAWIIRQMGSFPVYRGERDAWALAQAGRVLADGQILFMFPEGTRSRGKAQLRRGKIGAIRLALEHQVPVVPIAVWGTQNVNINLKRDTINIRAGEPLDVIAMAGPPPYKREIPRELTTVLMKRIAAMLPPEHRGVYA